MLFQLCLSLLVLHAMAAEEATKEDKAGAAAADSALEGKSLGYGYGYDNNYGRHGGHGRHSGYGKGDGYGGGHGHGGYGHGGQRQHQHTVPIKIPYIDRNGCRFPGDVVCASDDGADLTQYGYCLLTDESKNLWKKPTMEIEDVACEGTSEVLDDWCNDNERILKASGLIQEKDSHRNVYHHQKKYAIQLNPCLRAAR